MWLVGIGVVEMRVLQTQPVPELVQDCLITGTARLQIVPAFDIVSEIAKDLAGLAARIVVGCGGAIVDEAGAHRVPENIGAVVIARDLIIDIGDRLIFAHHALEGLFFGRGPIGARAVLAAGADVADCEGDADRRAAPGVAGNQTVEIGIAVARLRDLDLRGHVVPLPMSLEHLVLLNMGSWGKAVRV